MKQTHFNLNLDRETHHKLKLAACLKRTTMTKLVRELIEDFLLWEEADRKQKHKAL